MKKNICYPGFVSGAFSSLGEYSNGQLAFDLDGAGPVLFRHDALTNERDCCLNEIENIKNKLAQNKRSFRRLNNATKRAPHPQNVEELAHAAYMIRFKQQRQHALRERVHIIDRLIGAQFSLHC